MSARVRVGRDACVSKTERVCMKEIGTERESL